MPAFDAVDQALANFIATVQGLRREGEQRERYPQRTSAACMPWDLPLSSYAKISEDFRNRVTECARAAG